MKNVEKVISFLIEKGYTLTTAESCTGGMIAAAITDVPGASAVFEAGFVTYSNRMKTAILGVPGDVLESVGAVSFETVEAMARGAARVSGSDIALSVSGIAGPGGGTPEKPVGLVYIGMYIREGIAPDPSNDGVTLLKCNFSGSRGEVRRATVDTVFSLLAEKLGL